MDDRQTNPEPVAVPVAKPVIYPGQRKNICITLPWYKMSNPLTAFSVMGLIDRRRTCLMLNYGDAFVVHSRNTLADLFLMQDDLEWMLTIDDDMVIPFGNGEWFNNFTGMKLPEPFCNFNAVDRLMSHGQKLIGGLYFGRWRHGAAMFAEGFRDKTIHAYLRKGPRNEIRPTRWVGTGCTLIHKDVFLGIEKKFPHLARSREGGKRGGNWFTSSEHDLRTAVDEALAMLEPGKQATPADVYRLLADAKARAQHTSSLGTGEDVIFCHRAAAAGFQPYVDLGLICGHVGSEVFHPYNTD